MSLESTGIEGRLTLPMFNVPFRVIAAWNPARYSERIVNDERDAGTKEFVLKVGIGTTS